jgi:hypothetical protein
MHTSYMAYQTAEKLEKGLHSEAVIETATASLAVGSSICAFDMCLPKLLWISTSYAPRYKKALTNLKAK